MEPRRLSRWVASCFLPLASSLAVLSGTGEARADILTSHRVHDEPGLADFRIESEGENALVCVLLPSASGACEGLDTSQAALTARSMMLQGSTVVAMAAIRDPNASVEVLVYRNPLQGRNLEAEVLEGILLGMQRAIVDRPGARVIEQPHRTRIRGHEAIRLVMDRVDQGAPIRTTLVGLFGSRQLHVVLFRSPVSQAARADPSIEHMISTLVYEPGDLGSFGHSRKDIQRERFNSLATTLGIAAVVLAIGYSLFKKRKVARG